MYNVASLAKRGGTLLDISGNMLALLLALISGVLMAIQGTVNASLSKFVGLIEATFIVHISGTVALLIILFVFRMGKGNIGAISSVPWYAYLGGIVGVFIIYLVAASIPAVGVANATTAIIVGQVLTAVIIDHFGGFGMKSTLSGWNQFAGLVFLAIGAKLLLK